MALSSNMETGLRAEEAAARFLLSEGFRLLHRNWRSGRYELDIVAERDGVLHIVEVKCRRDGGLTMPEEAMTRAKFRSLFRAAEQYIALYGLDMDTQFDLISVLYDAGGGYRLQYIPEVMTPHW